MLPSRAAFKSQSWEEMCPPPVCLPAWVISCTFMRVWYRIRRFVADIQSFQCLIIYLFSAPTCVLEGCRGANRCSRRGERRERSSGSFYCNLMPPLLNLTIRAERRPTVRAVLYVFTGQDAQSIQSAWWKHIILCKVGFHERQIYFSLEGILLIYNEWRPHRVWTNCSFNVIPRGCIGRHYYCIYQLGFCYQSVFD